MILTNDGRRARYILAYENDTKNGYINERFEFKADLLKRIKELKADGVKPLEYIQLDKWGRIVRHNTVFQINNQ